MQDLINKIAAGIFRMEGRPLDHHNPGNLRLAPWLPKGTWGIDKYGFWVPSSRAQGVAGAIHVIALRIAMGQSLRELLGAYAPSSDGNNTEAYIKAMLEWTGIPSDTEPLWNYLEVPPLTLPGDKPVPPT